MTIFGYFHQRSRSDVVLRWHILETRARLMTSQYGEDTRYNNASSTLICTGNLAFFTVFTHDINNWVRKIARVTRADRGRMVELREETGVQRSLTERLVRSRLQWVGHIERMSDDRLPKRAVELCEESRRRRGRPMLRWEDCVNPRGDQL